MAYLNTLVLDNGLAVLAGADRRLDICKWLPTIYAEATGTFSLGNKTGLTLPSPSAMSSPPGRQVTVPAITDGVVTVSSTDTTDDAEFWAISDPTNFRLLAAGPLSAADLVLAGDGFTLTSFGIGIPLPA